MLLRPGPVHLSVASLARSLDYYEREIGLRARVRDFDSATAALGTGGEDLLVLHEQPGARPADGYAGLFHCALLLPTREDLARWLVHASRDRVALTGLSDHAVSEALYLRDPDGHGIEIYADRPREIWEGQVSELMTTVRLDTDDLIASLGEQIPETFTGLPEDTVMGHVHLRVSEIAATSLFYRGLGFEAMAEFPGQAVFLATEGYHHHVGANVWESRGRPLAPPDTARLLKFSLVGDVEPAVLTDPSGITVELLAR